MVYKVDTLDFFHTLHVIHRLLYPFFLHTLMLGFNHGVSPFTANPANAQTYPLNGCLRIESVNFDMPNKHIQTYCGLKLTESRTPSLAPHLHNSFAIHSTENVSKTGKRQRFFGLKITDTFSPKPPANMFEGM